MLLTLYIYVYVCTLRERRSIDYIIIYNENRISDSVEVTCLSK